MSRTLIPCAECGEPTQDLYALRRRVWRRAARPNLDDWLHITCVERRLGRRLTPDDFADLPAGDPRLSRLTPVHLDRLAGRLPNYRRWAPGRVMLAEHEGRIPDPADVIKAWAQTAPRPAPSAGPPLLLHPRIRRKG